MSNFDKQCQRCHGIGKSKKAQPKPIPPTVSPSPLRSYGQTGFICPKCRTENFYSIDAALPQYSLSCPSCNTAFWSRVVKIRAKRSRGGRSAGRRDFSVRVYDYKGTEELIEFANVGIQDFELRAKDIVVFTYIGKHLKIVQNRTINLYYVVSAPSCYLATYVYGPASSEVALLRSFRDEVLLDTALLSSVVTLYYWLSATAISRYGNSHLFNFGVQLAVRPVIWVMSHHLKAKNGCELK